MKTLIHSKIVWSLTFIIISILAIGMGMSVFRQFEASAFSHNAVPVVYSITFLALLIALGAVLGFRIKPDSRLGIIIKAWSMFHVLIFFASVFLGMVWEIFWGVAFVSLTLMPMNLIGEGISLGYQIHMFIIAEDKSSFIEEIWLAWILNMLIIAFALIEVSKKLFPSFF